MGFTVVAVEISEARQVARQRENDHNFVLLEVVAEMKKI
jgi:hypothetical protein